MYRSPNIIRAIKSRRFRWARHVSRMEEGSSFIRKETLRRPRHRWKEHIKIELKEIGINTRNWVDSAQEGFTGVLVNAALNLRVS